MTLTNSDRGMVLQPIVAYLSRGLLLYDELSIVQILMGKDAMFYLYLYLFEHPSTNK